MCSRIFIQINCKLSYGIIFFLLLTFENETFGQYNSGKSDEEVLHLKTGEGVEFGIWGVDLKKTPKPVLFILSSTIDETLSNEYFRQCGNRLGREFGWICVSIDLPYHGGLKTKGEPGELVGWAVAVSRGIDFVQENNKRMKSVLEYLIAEGYADKKKIALCGTSRGGFLALQFAAAEPMVKSLAVFAPVTDLSVLREFAGIKKTDIPMLFSLENKIEVLSGKWIWVVIGNMDTRVNTDEVIRFARNISRVAQNNKLKGGVELNVMFEPRGHTTPAGSVDRAVEWISKKSDF